jgi:hypothetical protein
MAKRTPAIKTVRLHTFHLDRGTMRFECDLCGSGMNILEQCPNANAPLWTSRNFKGDQEAAAEWPDVKPWEEEPIEV